tara:strand:- start:1813 stop:2655 length:843 start_codon:yes stop_codon:yes gene_type:complete
MPTNAELMAMEEEKNKRGLKNKVSSTEDELPIEPVKKLSGNLKEGGGLIDKAISIKGAASEIGRFSTNMQTASGRNNEGAGDLNATRTGEKEREVQAKSDVAEQTSDVGSKLVGSSLKKGMEKTASNILAGKGTKNITDIVKSGAKSKAVTAVGEGIGGVAGVVTALAGSGEDKAKEEAEKKSLQAGGFKEKSGETKQLENVSKTAKDVGTVAAVGAGVGATLGAVGATVAGAAGTVFSTNFWNPVGWVAAGVGLIASLFGSKSSEKDNKDQIRTRGRGR